jgi:hypothetical protein
VLVRGSLVCQLVSARDVDCRLLRSRQGHAVGCRRDRAVVLTGAESLRSVRLQVHRGRPDEIRWAIEQGHVCDVPRPVERWPPRARLNTWRGRCIVMARCAVVRRREPKLTRAGLLARALSGAAGRTLAVNADRRRARNNAVESRRMCRAGLPPELVISRVNGLCS